MRRDQLNQLGNELARYAASKRSMQGVHNVTKADFFADVSKSINSGDLTIASLTEKLKEAGLTNLFYHGRKGQGHESSKSAKKVKALYRSLGVQVHDHQLSAMLRDDFNFDEFSKEQQRHIIKAHQRYPANPYIDAHFQHELKGFLNFNEADDVDKTAAEALAARFSQDGVVVKETLNDYLGQLNKFDSSYFRDFIADLHRAMWGSPTYGDFCEAVVSLSVSEGKFDFFRLSPELQASIQDYSLEHDAEESAGIKGAVYERLLNEGEGVAIASTRAKVLENKIDNDDELTIVVGKVFSRLDDSKERRINREQAIARIDRYIDSKWFDSVKTRFFKDLKQNIKQHGLTTQGLQQALTKNQANLPNIFYKRFGDSEDCQAARCLADLFKLAALQDDDPNMSDMVAGLLPEADAELADRQTAHIKAQIKSCIQAPQDSPKTSQVRQINREVDRFKCAADVLHRDRAHQIATAESIYQKRLIEKGFEQAEGRLSLQGHLLAEVTLDEDEYNQIILDILECTPDAEGLLKGDNTHKENLEILLGLDQATLTEATYLNVDVSSCDEQFCEKYLAMMPNKDSPETKDFVKRSRSSIRPLQFEAEMHMRISSRVFEKLAGGVITQEQWRAVRHVAAKKLEPTVHAIFRCAITASHLDLVELNGRLDRASRDLEATCKEVLIEACFDQVPGFYAIYQEHIGPGLTNPNNTHLFEETTATGLDMLRTDSYYGVSERMSATTHTAHDKQPCAPGESSESQAHRVIHRCGYSVDEGLLNVKPLVGAGVKSRVPSIALRHEAHDVAVQDVANKLASSYQRLQAQRGGATGPQKYNLLTSLHTKVYDRIGPEGKNNQQRRSAARILKGSHIFNKRQVEAGHVNDLFYVQAIAVNQSTHHLGFNAFDDAVCEATLMSEMAMLSTLVENSHQLPSGLARTVNQAYQFAHRSYVEFLKDGAKGRVYFKDSVQGKKLIDYLRSSKLKFMQSAQLIKRSDSVGEMATGALFRLCSSNAYQDKQFGMLTQAVSMFLEKVFQAGCKSANERYGFTAAQEAAIDSLARRVAGGSNDFSATERAFITALKDYATGATASPQSLQIALNKVFAQHNAESLSPMVACEDQGGPSKLDVTSGSTEGVVGTWNRYFGTNNTMPPEARVGAHRYASKWQPHKQVRVNGEKISHLAHLRHIVEVHAERMNPGDAVAAPVEVRQRAASVDDLPRAQDIETRHIVDGAVRHQRSASESNAAAARLDLARHPSREPLLPLIGSSAPDRSPVGIAPAASLFSSPVGRIASEDAGVGYQAVEGERAPLVRVIS